MKISPHAVGASCLGEGPYLISNYRTNYVFDDYESEIYVGTPVIAQTRNGPPDSGNQMWQLVGGSPWMSGCFYFLNAYNPSNTEVVYSENYGAGTGLYINLPPGQTSGVEGLLFTPSPFSGYYW